MARCAGVFLDAGANRGDTLFSWYRVPACVDGPRLKNTLPPPKPGDPCDWKWPWWLPLETRRTWCAESYEANANFTRPLRQAAAVLRAELPAVASIAVHTSTAVGVRDGVALLGVDAVHGVGSSLQLQRRAMDSGGRAGSGAPVGRITQRVRVVDAVRVVADLGATGVPVALKLDIEGTEYEVLRDLMLTGLLCRHVQTLWVEFHQPAAPAPAPAPSRPAFEWTLRSHNASWEALEREWLPLASARCATTLLRWD